MLKFERARAGVVNLLSAREICHLVAGKRAVDEAEAEVGGNRIHWPACKRRAPHLPDRSRGMTKYQLPQGMEPSHLEVKWKMSMS
jgi:hypothetical protein